ncbi:MAG: MarR family transcriptional regulator [Polyangiaceae bacterium]
MQTRQPQPPAQTSAPTFWINHASRMVLRRFDDRLRPLGFSMAYIRVAVALEEHGPLQQKDLLKYVAIEQPTMTALLTRMERDRLVARKTDPTDARARLVSLTSRGSTGLTKAREVMRDVAEETMVGVSKEDRERLIRTLQLVVRNLTDESVERSGGTA